MSRAFTGNAPAQRFCQQHGGFAPIAGGHWRLICGGRNRRWLCAACAIRERERGESCR